MKVALITGASRGIGRALALAFGNAGYAVAVHYHKEKAKADAVVEEIKQQGRGDAFAVDCDVRDSLRVRLMVDAILSAWGQVDVLVNNAGITRDRTILKMTNGEWNDVIDTNLTGSFWCLRETARAMSYAKRGAIIQIASVQGVRGGFGNANYAASKAGLIGMTKGAARELGRFNITVNAVLPGFHSTDMASALSDSDRTRLSAEHVMGHPTDLSDLARMVLELAQTTSVSGQIFNVDSRVL